MLALREVPDQMICRSPSSGCYFFKGSYCSEASRSVVLVVNSPPGRFGRGRRGELHACVEHWSGLEDETFRLIAFRLHCLFFRFDLLCLCRDIAKLVTRAEYEQSRCQFWQSGSRLLTAQ